MTQESRIDPPVPILGRATKDSDIEPQVMIVVETSGVHWLIYKVTWMDQIF